MMIASFKRSRIAFIGSLATASLPFGVSKANCSSSEKSIVLYQYKICPFCNRVKAFMDYNSISYESVEVNPLSKKEIKFSPDRQKVPIAKIGGEVVVNSADIMERIRKEFPSKEMEALWSPDAEQWLKWSETKLAVYLYPNITRNFSEAWESFAYTGSVRTWSFAERWSNRILGPVAMAFANPRIKDKYGIKDERKELNALLLVWTNALTGQYLHGDVITMPDITVYGVLKSIEGFPTFNEIMTSNAVLKTWYDNVSAVVRKNQRITE